MLLSPTQERLFILIGSSVAALLILLSMVYHIRWLTQQRKAAVMSGRSMLNESDRSQRDRRSNTDPHDSALSVPKGSILDSVVLSLSSASPCVAGWGDTDIHASQEVVAGVAVSNLAGDDEHSAFDKVATITQQAAREKLSSEESMSWKNAATHGRTKDYDEPQRADMVMRNFDPGDMATQDIATKPIDCQSSKNYDDGAIWVKLLDPVTVARIRKNEGSDDASRIGIVPLAL